jgi:M6 family metalloprotease-like protein
MVDFAPYDQDGDCYVDALAIIHQGTGEEASPLSTDIWSHSWDLNSAYYSGFSHHGNYTTNDRCAADTTRFVKVKDYIIMPEKQDSNIATIGVFAHEYGHVLGLPDLYDTDGSSEGIGRWSLMASGSWNGLSHGGDRPAHLDPWSKYAMNWIAPTQLTTSTTGINFAPAATDSSFYQLRPGSPLTGSGEYFLVENRQQTGFDAGLPGNGLLVWHIDEQVGTDNDREWYPGCTNCSSHYKVALIQADGLYQLEKNSNRGDGGDPFPGSASRTAISALTTPNNTLYSAASSGFSISGITSVAQLITADITVLDTAITAGPDSLTNATTASFSFTSTESGTSFECRIDSGSWGSCSTPASFSGLADGLHTFSVRARDYLGAIDTTPASVTWTIDTIPPETAMSSGPVSPTTATGASFAFSSADPGATFTCRLDAGSWTPCTTPTAYNNIPVGEHTFSVRARDLAGNDDQTPAAWNWVVTTGDIKLLAAGQPDSYYTLISAALANFPAGSTPTISLKAMTYAEAITIDRCGEQMTLAGGYNGDFTAVIGRTIVNSPVTVTCGTLIANILVIR